jgi:putative sterol carrier protein
MDLAELSEKIAEIASKDEKLKENMKETKATIVMELKDLEDTFYTFSINKGDIEFQKGKPGNIDFQFEISKNDYKDLLTGKKAGLILMATKKLKMVKGSMSEIGKIIGPLGAVPKIGKEIVQNNPIEC